MSFSHRQQPEFRGLVKGAWEAHCLREGLPAKAKMDRDWYERELTVATGKASTTECNGGRDYDRAMAHFEGLAGVGIAWQMRVYSGDVKRMLHSLAAELGAQALRAAGVDEGYVLGALRQGYGARKPWELEPEELVKIVAGVKRHVRRRMQGEKEGAMEDGQLPMAEGQGAEAAGEPDWTV